MQKRLVAFCAISGAIVGILVLLYWLSRPDVKLDYRKGFYDNEEFRRALAEQQRKRLEELLSPRWLRIGGYWYPRGGMPIDVFYQTAEPPAGLWLPDQGVAPYRGRG